jgi:hypothetical protein
MKSELTGDFIGLFAKLPNRIKILARKNYRIWKQNPAHPSLNFKEVKIGTNIYSVRIGIGWRAIGIIKDEIIIWFWIGSHSDYDNLLNKLK